MPLGYNFEQVTNLMDLASTEHIILHLEAITIAGKCGSSKSSSVIYCSILFCSLSTISLLAIMVLPDFLIYL